MSQDDELAPLLQPYIDREGKPFIRACDKVACLLTNKTQEDYGITDEQLEQSLEGGAIGKEMHAIAEMVGELLEDLELDCDTVDQAKQLFLLIDPYKDNVA